MTLEQSIEKHPLVAINCMVYNHEPYLRKCLDGFVMQQTTFPVVAFVHDDCSTDGSAAIIAEYAEKYPDIICPMYEEENQYQYNHRTARIVEKACVESGAKYIAECEGDDYWTHPLKLQKQVDFMESHPDYSACWHNFSIINCSTGKFTPARAEKVEMDAEGGAEVTVERYLYGKCGGQPLSLLYRVSMYDFNCRDRYKYFRDVHHAILLLKAGKGRYMSFDGATYHAHSDSATNNISRMQYADSTIYILLELHNSFSEDKDISSNLQEVIVWSYRHHKLAHKTRSFWRLWYKNLKHAPVVSIKAMFTILRRTILRKM